MKIIIDGRSFGYGTSSNILISILYGLDYSKNEYSIIGKKEVFEKLNLPLKIINDDSKNNGFKNYINFSLSKLINTYDIFFTPYYLIPKGITISSYCIFYDTSFIDCVKSNKKLKRRFNYSYRVADKIFTFSNFSKNRIEEIYGKYKDVIVLSTPLLLNDYVKNNKREDYYLCLGRFKKHKNIEFVINTFKKKNITNPIHIVLLKEKLTKNDRNIIKKYKADSQIKILDSLTNDEFREEIKNAKALIDSSSYSGISYPIYLAVQFGTPVICSDIESHKELYKNNNVIFFKSEDEDSFVSVLEKKKYINTTYDDKFIELHDTKEIATELVSYFEINKNKVKTKRNFIFNLIYQFLVVLTPLITTPYISRVLGADNIGKFSFAYTITYYFVIIAYFGFTQYAQRAIAEVQNDKEEQSRVFWQITILKLIPASISILGLSILHMLHIFGDYSIYIHILSILVVGTMLDINFYFHGKENYFFVMAVNLIIRLVFLICIFVFVKSRSDTKLYTLFYALMVVGSYASMWLALPMNLRKVKLKTLNFKKHMKQSLILFFPVAAVSIYAILDKTLIGVLMHGQTYHKVGYITIIANISDLENGYYYQAERIIKALLSIISAFGIVMSSRNTIEYSAKHKGAVKKNIYNSFRFVFAIGIPAALGTVLIANSFVPLFFGQGYDEVINLLMIYAPVIIIIGISNVIGIQYLLPLKRDKEYAIAVMVGFIVNLGFNCLLIPFLGSKGAVIGTIISESIIVIIEAIYIRKEISFRVVFISVWKYILAGLIMVGLGLVLYYFVLTQSKIKDLFNLIILIPFGAVLYFLVLLLLKDKYIFYYTKYILSRIKSVIVFLKTSVIDDILIENFSKFSNKKILLKDKIVISGNKEESEDGNKDNFHK